MVDISQLTQLFLNSPAFFGAVFLAAGFLLGLAGRAVSLLVLGAGLLVTVLTAVGKWETQQDLILEAIVLGGGLGVSGLLALATRTGSLAAQFAVFLAAWFLLLRAWIGPSFVSTTFGSALWIVATGVTASISARLGRVFPRGATLRAASRAGGSALLHPPKP